MATSTLALPGSTASTLPEPEPGEDALAALVQDDRWLTEADEDGTPVQKPIRRSGKARWLRRSGGSVSIEELAEFTGEFPAHFGHVDA